MHVPHEQSARAAGREARSADSALGVGMCVRKVEGSRAGARRRHRAQASHPGRDSEKPRKQGSIQAELVTVFYWFMMSPCQVAGDHAVALRRQDRCGQVHEGRTMVSVARTGRRPGGQSTWAELRRSEEGQVIPGDIARHGHCYTTHSHGAR